MRTERMIAVLITIWAWSSIETGQAAAQDAPQPPLPSSVIPLERTEVSTPEAVSTPPPPVPQAASPVDRRQVRPSRQAGSPGGQAAVGQLRNPFESGGGHGGTPVNRVATLQNPFEWGEKGPRRGLFGMSSPQAQPTPQETFPGAVPSAPITGLEGAPPVATETAHPAVVPPLPARERFQVRKQGQPPHRLRAPRRLRPTTLPPRSAARALASVADSPPVRRPSPA